MMKTNDRYKTNRYLFSHAAGFGHLRPCSLRSTSSVACTWPPISSFKQSSAIDLSKFNLWKGLMAVETSRTIAKIDGVSPASTHTISLCIATHTQSYYCNVPITNR